MTSVFVRTATPPVYHGDTQRTLGVLQQLQVLLAHAPDAVTLDDVARQIEMLQIEFGPTAVLEDVIQHLVARQLAFQCAQRKAPQPEVAA